MYDTVFMHFGIEKEDFQIAFAEHELHADEQVAERHAYVEEAIPEDLTKKITDRWLTVNQQGHEEAEEGSNKRSF